MRTAERRAIFVSYSRHDTAEASTVCVALKTYGMYLGGSSGSLFDLQGVTDPRWTDEFLDDIKQMVPTDFEVVDTGEELR